MRWTEWEPNWDWEKWFAWKPVKVFSRSRVQWVWLEWVERRVMKVDRMRSGIKRAHWEYRDRRAG